MFTGACGAATLGIGIGAEGAGTGATAFGTGIGAEGAATLGIGIGAQGAGGIRIPFILITKHLRCFKRKVMDIQEEPSCDDWQIFLQRIFGSEKQRRVVLFGWHSFKSKADAERLADVFYGFMFAILYERFHFHQFLDYFTIFGNAYPIRHEWLPEEERQFLVIAMAHRKTQYTTVREYTVGQFECSGIVHPNITLSLPIRRQLARDFVWLIANTGDSNAIQELIAAMQRLIVQHHPDVFLAHLVAGLNGTCLLKQIPCWGLTAWDKHPEDL